MVHKDHHRIYKLFHCHIALDSALATSSGQKHQIVSKQFHTQLLQYKDIRNLHHDRNHMSHEHIFHNI